MLFGTRGNHECHAWYTLTSSTYQSLWRSGKLFSTRNSTVIVLFSATTPRIATRWPYIPYCSTGVLHTTLGELGSVPPETAVELTLSGTLQDGTPFEASDCVLMMHPAPPTAPSPQRKGRLR